MYKIRSEPFDFFVFLLSRLNYFVFVLPLLQLFKVDIASDVFEGEERLSVPPFLVLATDGIWDETSANTVVEEVRR